MTAGTITTKRTTRQPTGVDGNMAARRQWQQRWRRHGRPQKDASASSGGKKRLAGGGETDDGKDQETGPPAPLPRSGRRDNQPAWMATWRHGGSGSSGGGGTGGPKRAPAAGAPPGTMGGEAAKTAETAGDLGDGGGGGDKTAAAAVRRGT